MSSDSRRAHPLRPNVDKSPYLPATEQAGAVSYIVYNNTYWPVDYGRDPVEEYRAVDERAVLIDVGCERSVELRGTDAVRFADYLCTRDLSKMKVGRARHTAVCEPNGVILCEAIVLKLDDERVWICHGPVDFLQWTNAIAAHTDFDVDVSQTQVFPLAVQGPRAYEIMKELAPDAADLKFFDWIIATIAGVETVVVRSGYTGEFGFEIFPFDPDEAPQVWDAVLEAGEPHGILISPMVGPFFERGVTDFRYGDRLDLNPFELRLGRAVDLDAGTFVGKEALKRVQAEGPRRKLVGVRFDSDVRLPEMTHYWPFENGLGMVTRVKRSYYLGEWIGYAVVESIVSEDTQVKVSHPEGTVTAQLVELPFMK